MRRSDSSQVGFTPAGSANLVIDTPSNGEVGNIPVGCVYK